MKKLEYKITIEVRDSDNVEDFVSDIEDGILCDNVKTCTIEYEKDGKTQTKEFDNIDFLE